MLDLLRQTISQFAGPELKREAADLERLLESPKQTGHGQLALPVFAWAKEAKMPPPELAKQMAARLMAIKPNEIEKITPVSGFVNFDFSPVYLQSVVAKSVLAERGRVGYGTAGRGQKLVIDFCSPNVAKPMHVGHLRAAVIGQAIVNLAKAQGYDVVGLNHLGDWGVQFGKLAWAYQHWGHEYPFAEKPFESLYDLYVRFHEAAEKDAALEAEGSKIFRRLEEGDPEIGKIWQTFVTISLTEYQRIWDRLGIRHDLVRGESFYNDRLKAVEEDLEKKNLMEASDGAMVVRLDDDGMPPCLIRKSDGASLYATRDLASAIYRKEELKADLNLYVVGVDQTLHFRQVFRVLEKMGYDWAKDCHHVAFGMYRFKDGKISTRKGNTIFLEDVLSKAVELVRGIIASKNPDLENADQVAEMVGVGAIVFNDLVNDRVKNVEFDWDRVLDFEGDSGPYVQYCGVRCKSLARKYGKPIRGEFAAVLSSEQEKELMRFILSYEDVLRHSFRMFKPHVLAGYLLEVCRRFNAFYTHCRILGEGEEIQSSRMTLVEATRVILEEGLGHLGIRVPESM
ncbi:MAG: arginine--tRNA ligase [Bdellovibrionales bacterium]